MTLRQQFLKLVYPIFMWSQKAASRKGIAEKKAGLIIPKVSFYSLHATLSNGKPLSFEQLKGKYVLLVNTASFCGYTGQYDDLEKLHQQFKEKLVVLGFPANEFKEQEPGSDKDIASFCRMNFGVTFPLMKKAAVTGTSKQEVFEWLSSSEKNGWNDREPEWNFCKYLVDPEGCLVGIYPSAVNPLDAAILKHLR